MRNLNEIDLRSCIAKLPQLLKDAMRYDSNIIVAGGFIRSVIAKEPINDIDVFVSDINKAQQLTKQLTSLVKSEEYITRTKNATTIKSNPVVQIIHRWTFNDMVECINSFDFTITKAAIQFDKIEDRFIGKVDDRYYEDLSSKRLIYTNPIREEEAGGSMLRVFKYYKRGYTIELNSLAQVISRMINNPYFKNCYTKGDNVTTIISTLLYEVDPSTDSNEIINI